MGKIIEYAKYKEYSYKLELDTATNKIKSKLVHNCGWEIWSKKEADEKFCRKCNVYFNGPGKSKLFVRS